MDHGKPATGQASAPVQRDLTRGKALVAATSRRAAQARESCTSCRKKMDRPDDTGNP